MRLAESAPGGEDPDVSPNSSASGPAPLLYESHCHTPLCKHAFGEPLEFAAVAAARNLRGITFTCHCPLPDGNSAHIRMGPEQYGDYLDLIAATHEAYAGSLDVRTGIESDYFPGVEPWLEELHARAPLSHILGSVHYQLAPYRRLYYRGDTLAYQQIYFEHLAMSAETGLFDTLAHPDLVKNESPSEWDFERLRDDICRALDRIAATGVAMELNTSGMLKSLPEMNPSLSQLALMHERGIPVVIGADAHSPERVGDGYAEALQLLIEAGYKQVSFFVDRTRRDVPIQEALASLVEEPVRLGALP
ncbi:histidinol-phosphatase [Luteolibacter rhizosphaerae]|uniref:histidinol-phosphatase n=1 Tax=Luteolibacter rhizosphaerae TaxID=2989719 RepID=UPI002223A051|nr:histidinol-phosphatase [Luteolibacter rhizosphaerae]